MTKRCSREERTRLNECHDGWLRFDEVVPSGDVSESVHSMISFLHCLVLMMKVVRMDRDLLKIVL